MVGLATTVCIALALTIVRPVTCSGATSDIHLGPGNIHPGGHYDSISGDEFLQEHHNTTHEGSHGNNTHGHHFERYPIITIEFDRIHSPFIIGIWIFLACIGKIAFHMTPKLSHIFPESVMIIILGLVIGGILFMTHPDYQKEKIVSPLTAHSFFIYLLPPIILDAGYFMPNRLFFDHLGTILTFAVVGTIWNALTIGISLYTLALTGLFGEPSEFPILHILLFASLISAVDPVAVLAVFEEIHVEEVLFILVFGESLLNDGVTVVLYHMFEGFSTIGEDNIIPMDIINSLISFLLVALGGTAIGIIWGFLTALVTRFTHQVRVIEPVFIFVMSYLSYLNAELFHFSGILAITFCGITMKNYTEQNISKNSSTTIRYAMKMLASSSETVIFLFLGVATVHGTEHEFNGWFILFTIIFCSVYRTIGVLILSAVCNRFRVQKIDFVQQFMMSYGGLRGAVAFALAITINKEHIKLAPTFVTTTIAMVFFTVFLQGTTIKPLVEYLGVKKSVKRELKMNERLHEKSMDYIMSGVDSIVGKRNGRFFRTWFKRINNKYLQPLLVHETKYNEPKLFETLSHLQLQEAISNAADNPREAESVAQTLPKSLKDWNLDVGELDYEPGDRDLLDETFHHSLAEHFVYSRKRHSTYNRHAVSDSELRIPSDFEAKMKARANKRAALNKLRNRRNKKLNQLQNHGTSSADLQKKLEALEELQKTAKDNLAFVPDDDMSVPMIRFRPGPGVTTAETLLPWKRHYTVHEEEPRTMAESYLPWKRTGDEFLDDHTLPKKYEAQFHWKSLSEQTEDHYSPSNTYLNKIPTSGKRIKLEDVFIDPPEKQERPAMRNTAMENWKVFRRASETPKNFLSELQKSPRVWRSGSVDMPSPRTNRHEYESLSSVKEENETSKKNKSGHHTVVNISQEDGTKL